MNVRGISGEKTSACGKLFNVARVVEGGYATDDAELKENIKKVIAAGAVGINFEDQIVVGEGLYTVEEQCARIEAIREAAEQSAIPLFINARTDIFLKTYPAKHDETQLDEAIRRAAAYTRAGANGFFVPGLRDTEFIKKLGELSLIPLNIMVLPDTPPPRTLAKLGVSRISYGPQPYRQMTEALKESGRKAFSDIS